MDLTRQVTAKPSPIPSRFLDSEESWRGSNDFCPHFWPRLEHIPLRPSSTTKGSKIWLTTSGEQPIPVSWTVRQMPSSVFSQHTSTLQELGRLKHWKCVLVAWSRSPCFPKKWRFPKIGVPPNHPYYRWVFHDKPTIWEVRNSRKLLYADPLNPGPCCSSMLYLFVPR